MVGKFWALPAAAVLAGTSVGAIAQVKSQAAPTASNTYAIRHPNSNFSGEYDSRVRLNFENKPQAAQSEARAVADCLLTRAKGKAADMLAGSNDLNFSKLQKALTGKYSQCNRVSAAGVPLVVINTALAEAILRSENRSFQAHTNPTDWAAAKAFYTSANGVTMDSLGRCLAVYSPGMINSVLATPAGSASEKKALEALYAETPECGVRVMPAGIPADEQRNALATGLYSWLHRG